jgi:hypothetical protein
MALGSFLRTIRAAPKKDPGLTDLIGAFDTGEFANIPEWII